MEPSGHTLLVEILVASGFLLLAVLDFKTNFWLIVARLLARIFDFVHHFLIHNPVRPTGGRVLLVISMHFLVCSWLYG